MVRSDCGKRSARPRARGTAFAWLALGVVLAAACTDATLGDSRAPSGGTGGAGTTGRAADAGAPATAIIRFVPDRRTFTDSLEIRLEADHPEATIHYTLDDTPPTPESPVYRSPIRIVTSTIVRAFVRSPRVGEGKVQDQGFVKLGGDAVSFSSDVPVLLVHSFSPRPTAKFDVKPAVLLVFEPDARTGRAGLTQPPALDTRIGIKVRGSTSANYVKKPYKIELWGGTADEDADKPLLGMPAESDFHLIPGYSYDRAYVRNAFIYEVSRRIGRYAPRTRFAEVLFAENGADATYTADYLGLYSVTEKLKIGKNRVAITNPKSTDVTEPSVTGGYIWKIDRRNPGETGFRAGYGPNNIWGSPCAVGIPGFCNIWTLPWAFHDPHEQQLAPEQKAYIARVVDEAANAIANRRDYDRLIDVPSFIDHHILNLLAKNPDAFRLSGYMHKNRGDGKIVAGPIWDFDRTMSCAPGPATAGVDAYDRRTLNPTWWDPTNQTDDTTNFFHYGWYRGLFADPAFKAAYFKRLKELLEAELRAEKLEALVDELAKQVGREAPERDVRRWPDAPPRNGFTGEVQRLKEWLRRRVEWMSGCVSLPDPVACPGRDM